MTAPSSSTGSGPVYGKLAIVRGKTRQPLRPINAHPYLIGSGAVCALQLGDDQIPMVHCVLRTVEGQWQVTALHPQPEVKLNGKVVQQSILNIGDRLDLGKIELEIRDLRIPESSQEPQVLRFSQDVSQVEQVELDLLQDLLAESVAEVQELEGTTTDSEEVDASQVEAFLAALTQYSEDHEAEMSAGELSETLEQMLEWINSTDQPQQKRKSA